MKSKVEERCRSAFQEFLEHIPGNEAQYWIDVNQLDEPPDYYLRLNEQEYAVEVTTLFEQVDLAGQRVPAITVTASLWELADEVAAIASQEQCLRGAYMVRFSSPIEDFSKVKGKLRDDLLAYVRETKDMENAPKKRVFKKGRAMCMIEKLHNQKDYIGKVGPHGGKWEGDIAQEVCVLLQERMATKQEKLSKISAEKILLLYDSYHFADPAMYRACLDKIAGRIPFHTLFLVSSNGPGVLLYSRNLL